MVQNDMGLSICKMDNIERICKEYRQKVHLQGFGENIASLVETSAWKQRSCRVASMEQLAI